MKSNKKNYLLLLLVGIIITSVSFEVLAKEEKREEEEILFREIPIVVTAVLTEAKPRLVPAAVTTITGEQIQASGARSLFELLDIYVPNLQWIRHHWESDHLGLRGIINDRDDKYLLLVNGRVMNDRTHYGAMSERDIVLLRDIHHIDIVRGPGSSLYGPGAVSMIINIITHNGQTFEGTEITTRLGAIEEFYSGEIKHGRKFENGDGGFFLYGGIGHYRGADKHDAPQIFPFNFPSGAGFMADGTQAGEPLLNPSINNDGEAHRNLPPLKLHAQITKGNWDIWARYTRGGQQGVWDMERLTSAADPNTSPPGDTKPNSYGYQQATGYVGYKKELNENIALYMAFSYDMLDLERYILERPIEAYREDEYYGKLLLRWHLNDQHRFAFGSEISHHELGLTSPGWPDIGAISGRLAPLPRWSTNMYSFMGEHQWTICDKFTSFLGARLDDHTYSKIMFSPRAAIVYTPNEKDTFKFMWARSVRANFEEEMVAQVMAGASDDSNPEKLDSLELRYKRRHSKNLDFAASVFIHYNLELISWSQSQMSSTNIGTQKSYGYELELSYHTEDTRLVISHGYTKLKSFDLEPGESIHITAEPYGYGDDLANWSNHITKLTAQHKLDDKWTLDGSLRIYWGFPGMKDWNHYRDYANTPTSLIEPGWNRAYRGNYYLNLGMQYQPEKNLTFRIDGLNLLGIFNKDLNKRNYLRSYGDFRSHAPSVAVAMIYKF